MQQRKFWKALLIVGLLFHIMAALVLPIGYDTFLHASFVTDGMNDGVAHLEWGAIRSGETGSTPATIEADGRWAVWHGIMTIMFSIFGSSTATLHLLGVIISALTLISVYAWTKSLYDEDMALKLTALVALYPPFIRATGRAYQEMWILLLVSCFFGLLLMGRRRQRSKQRWMLWLGAWCILPLIMMTKGMPWYWSCAALLLYPIIDSEVVRVKTKPYLPLLAYVVCLVILGNNDVSIFDFSMIEWLILGVASLGYAWLMFVYLPMFVFDVDSKEHDLDGEGVFLRYSWHALGWILGGWIAALWLVETSNTNSTILETLIAYRHNPRYYSLLILPIWWAYFSEMRTPSLDRMRGLSVAVLAGILLFNVYLINSAENPREMEVFGDFIAQETDQDTTILFLHDGQFAMHEMYVLQFALDPESSEGHTAHWRSTSSAWQHELSDCSSIGASDWVITSMQDDVYDLLNWQKVDVEGAGEWVLYQRPSSC